MKNLLKHGYYAALLGLALGFSGCVKENKSSEIQKDTAAPKKSNPKHSKKEESFAIAQKIIDEKKERSKEWEKRGGLRPEIHPTSKAALLERAVLNDPTNINLRMDLACHYQAMGKHSDGAELFKMIYTLYPTTEHAKTARYQEIVCRQQEAFSLKPTCDSTELENTLKLCANFLENSQNSEYAGQVDLIKEECKKKLLNKSTEKFDFYLSSPRNNLVAAESVIKQIRKEFDMSNEDVRQLVLYLECKVARFKKEKDLADSLLAQLEQEYPYSKYTKMAQGVKSKFFFNA